MNQAILFTDDQQWNEQQQAVEFSAQQSGALIRCFICLSELQSWSGGMITTPQQALTAFSEWRFDIEERAEQLIEEECFTSAGMIEVLKP
ncbi:DUF1488 domain-containing protein [Vibrio metschnikovii]|uniref:DUF1488 domain-containing protein n=1 Tax=Vibrio metschnikovii TaxID=28172 RepID=UPI001C2F8C08|nr:DUF1488 domain-containing protein [Vibrio metschnikovii]